MALYEYECPNCGIFEIIQKMTDEVLLTCPTCGEDVQKQISAPGIFILKGPGFFSNDYKKKES